MIGEKRGGGSWEVIEEGMELVEGDLGEEGISGR